MCPRGTKTSNYAKNVNSRTEFSVRLFKTQDEQELLCFLKKFMPFWTEPFFKPFSPYKNWVWKFRNNPFGSCIVVARSRGKIVGTIHMTPRRIKMGNLIVNCVLASDALVHPRFRRQGIFRSMGEFIGQIAPRQKMEMYYAFPGNQASCRGTLEFGASSHVCYLPMLVKILNPYNAVGLLGLKRKKPISNNKTLRNITNFLFLTLIAVRWFPSIFRDPKREPELCDVKIKRIRFFDERFDFFWKKVSRDYPILVVRDAKYLNWRFLENPNAKFEVFSAERDQQILGYIVLTSLSLRVGNHIIGYIADLLAPSNDTGIARALVFAALDYFRRKNVDSVICSMSKNSPIFKTLKWFGFFQARSTPLVVLLYTSRACKEIAGNFADWYITTGDTERI